MAGILFLTACTAPEKNAILAASTAPVPSASSETAATVNTEEMEEDALQTIEILVEGITFTAQLADTEAASQLTGYLPLELEMQELNGNEKYSYLSEPLSASASCPTFIHAGDLMLFGSDCLVLFYKDFSTSYSYTPLGRLSDPQGLSQALGRGNVRVTLQAAPR